MSRELDVTLARIGVRMAVAIPRLPEKARLWLLVSVALDRATVERFMGMSSEEVEARIADARRQVATELLRGESARVLEFRRSRAMVMRLVDAAARRRLRMTDGVVDSLRERIAAIANRWTWTHPRLAFPVAGTVVVAAVSVVLSVYWIGGSGLPNGISSVALKQAFDEGVASEGSTASRDGLTGAGVLSETDDAGTRVPDAGLALSRRGAPFPGSAAGVDGSRRNVVGGAVGSAPLGLTVGANPLSGRRDLAAGPSLRSEYSMFVERFGEARRRMGDLSRQRSDNEDSAREVEDVCRGGHWDLDTAAARIEMDLRRRRLERERTRLELERQDLEIARIELDQERASIEREFPLKGFAYEQRFRRYMESLETRYLSLLEENYFAGVEAYNAKMEEYYDWYGEECGA